MEVFVQEGLVLLLNGRKLAARILFQALFFRAQPLVSGLQIGGIFERWWRLRPGHGGSRRTS